MHHFRLNNKTNSKEDKPKEFTYCKHKVYFISIGMIKEPYCIGPYFSIKKERTDDTAGT